MYCPVLSWYKVVQGGTRWYMTVQGTVYGGTWRYMTVQESVKLYILECTGTYLFLRFNLDPADSLLQCCPAEGAVLRPVHLITVMQAQACFNQEVLGLPPPLPARRPRGGVGGAAGARGAAAASAAAGPGGGAAVSESARGTTTCCRRRQRRQRGRALVRMQPW
jgi:hypothetical protein